MTYVDGFVFVVSKKKIPAYTKMAREAGKIWKKHGALSYKECMGDDLHNKMPGLTFPKLTKLKKGETVWFSFITFKSKAHRDVVNKKVMKIFEEKYTEGDMNDMPFDMKRMSYGGFKTIVDL